MENRLKTLINLITCASFAIASSALNVRAEDESLPLPQSPDSLSIDQRIQKLHESRDKVSISGPRAGIPISIFVGVGGGTAAIVGSGFMEFAEGERTPASSGLLAIGIVAIVGGTIGIVVSAKKLHDRKEEIRQIDENIRYLESERKSVSVSYGAPQKPAMLRF